MDGYTSFRYAQSLLQVGRPTEAARVLEPVVAAEPSSTAGLTLLARAYSASAQLGRAEGALRRLVEVDPVDAWAHHALGRTLERLSRHEEARPHLLLAAALSPDPDFAAAAQRVASRVTASAAAGA